jgi:hypothetical protein
MFRIEREDGLAIAWQPIDTLVEASAIAMGFARKPEHAGFGFFVKDERGQVVAARTRD